MLFKILPFWGLLLFLSAQTEAQDTTRVAQAVRKIATVKLKDGTTINGTIVSNTEKELKIQTDNLGELVIAKEKIDSIEEGEGYYKKGQFWFQNPHSTRYLWAPSAYTLSKGEGYYQNAYIFVNSVTMGVTDHFTMGGGFVLNPTFRDWQVLFLTPKISFPSQSKVKFGAGVIAVSFFNTRYEYEYQPTYSRTRKGIEANLVGIGYGNMTVGNPDNNFSVGLGWAFSNTEIGSNPVLNFSYMGRMARKVGFVTENWVITGKEGISLLSGGIRFFGEKTAIDLALIVPAGPAMDGDFIAIPYVDFILKFGKKTKKTKS